jgi:hypothetical protein
MIATLISSFYYCGEVTCVGCGFSFEVIELIYCKAILLSFYLLCFKRVYNLFDSYSLILINSSYFALNSSASSFSLDHSTFTLEKSTFKGSDPYRLVLYFTKLSVMGAFGIRFFYTGLFLKGFSSDTKQGGNRGGFISF